MKFLTVLLSIFIAILSMSCSQAGSSTSSWKTNYQAALKEAQKKNQPVLLEFTGSDWCPWCKKLDKEVLSQADFKDYAQNNLQFVEVDFPRNKEQSKELQSQNQALSEKYHIEGFPTLVLISPQEEVIDQVGYLPGGPKPMISWVKSNLKKHPLKITKVKKVKNT